MKESVLAFKQAGKFALISILLLFFVLPAGCLSRVFAYSLPSEVVLPKPPMQIIEETHYIDKYFEIDQEGNFKEHIYLGNQKIADINQDDEINYVLTDHLGSPTIITDQTGEIVEINDYKSYGSINNTESTVDNTYKFTGKELDSETNLQYYGARYYDNIIGRFISVDPAVIYQPSLFLADPQQLNSYAYARNNPILYIDPWGLSTAISNVMPEGGWQLDQEMGEFNGVTAYYNGIGSDRMEHSCVEYAKRYMSQVYGINSIGVVRNPKTMWGMVDTINNNLALSGSEYSFVQHNNGQGFNLPNEGDLLIWTQGTYGHVMVVTESVFNNETGMGHVEVIDQNARNKAVRTYQIDKTSEGYAIMRNYNTPMAGWLSPMNKNGNSNSINNTYSAPTLAPSTGPSFWQRAWSDTKRFFGRLF